MFLGAFRGAAHQECNLAFKIVKKNWKLPILFHNLRGYDAHLIFQAVEKKHGKISVIPNNFERYISFTIGRMKFLDSLQFLAASLDQLAQNVAKFKHLSRAYPNANERKLLTKKGVYPYDHVNSTERFEETTLPTREQFYNKLNEEGCSEEKYAHAQTIWKTFKCTTMRDYHDLYLNTDVLLLADVFEEFRVMCLSSYQLDPVHYYSLPGLSWDAALKYSKVKLELIKDINMHQMIEQGIRGGVSMITHRYAKANHPQMNHYNAAQSQRTLMYLDANALYSKAMSLPLPVSDFAWLSEDEISALQIENMDAEFGYILEVNLFLNYT